VREYIWLPEAEIAPTSGSRPAVARPMAVVSDVSTSPLLSWVHVDHLHRPIRITSAAKLQVWEAVWQPWGDAHSINGSVALDARLPGQWFQIEAGLHYNWHRHYDPSLGRYTQPDPLGFVDGPSLYGYVGGGPIGFVDILGLAEGHHWVTGPIRNDPNLSPAAREVFNRNVTGELPGGHGWSMEHSQYNTGVKELYDRWLRQNNIDPRTMTPKQAEDFVREVKRCPDPRVANFRNSIIRQIMSGAFRRMPPFSRRID